MNKKEAFKYVLGIVIVIGFFGTLMFMISKDKYTTEVNMIVGALIGSFITVVGYYYGSSQGSADKGEILSYTKNK